MLDAGYKNELFLLKPVSRIQKQESVLANFTADQCWIGPI
jgi:hypothetical protein